MRPIVLKGHERSITFVKYNREGDLLFSASKDKFPTLWRADTGERIGTFIGHNGAVWSLDVSLDSSLLLTAAADNSARLWNVATGETLGEYIHDRPVRGVDFAHGSRRFCTVSDQVMGSAPMIRIFALPSNPLADECEEKPLFSIPGWSTQARITTCRWGPLNETIIATGDDGHIVVYDSETGKEVRKVKAHDKSIRAMAFDDPLQQLCFITGSKDTKAKLWSTRDLTLLKEYDTGRSINCVSMSPTRDHILLAGGQEAVDVALTRVDPAQFHTRIYHKVSGDELGQVAGHFGPVNTVSYSPDGDTFVSGGEDGYIRVHHLDDSYKKVLADENLERLVYGELADGIAA
jgi:translation initiation factor 3 subunit I